MGQLGKEFYEEWEVKQRNDLDRERILKWKADNLVSLIRKNPLSDSIKSICEVGGAEGTVLHNVGKSLNTSNLVNYELSTNFCNIGKSLYPEIKFKNFVFENDKETYDLVVLSDIIEHVDDVQLIYEASQRCRYAAFKIPIELCITHTDLYFKLFRKTKPENLKYGATHINGHLRGYTVNSAKKVVSQDHEILESKLLDVTQFYGTRLGKIMSKLFGAVPTVWMFGGALFLLARSKNYQ